MRVGRSLRKCSTSTSCEAFCCHPPFGDLPSSSSAGVERILAANCSHAGNSNPALTRMRWHSCTLVIEGASVSSVKFRTFLHHGHGIGPTGPVCGWVVSHGTSKPQSSLAINCANLGVLLMSALMSSPRHSISLASCLCAKSSPSSGLTVRIIKMACADAQKLSNNHAACQFSTNGTLCT